MYENEQVPVSPSDIVMDTCVIFDLLFSERERHADAKKLAELLCKASRHAIIPAHAFFEIVSALAAEKRRRQAPLTAVGSRTALLPFPNTVVSIDLAFVNDYLIAPLASGRFINVSGADMIFVAIALKHGLTLISEDEPLRKRAKDSGVSAMSVSEYIDQMSKEAA